MCLSPHSLASPWPSWPRSWAAGRAPWPRGHGCSRPGPLPEALPARIAGVSAGAWRGARRGAAARPGGSTAAAAGAGRHHQVRPRPRRGDGGDGADSGEGRSTVCVSSQAGCTRHCGFCATATLGFTRNLTAGEIVLQYAVARRGGARRRRPRATSCSWAWASRWTTSTRCSPRWSVLTEEAAPRLSVEPRHRLHLRRAAGDEALPEARAARTWPCPSTRRRTSSASG